MDIRELIGINCTRLRRDRGLSQEELAERSGVSQQYVSDLERGKRNPTILTLVHIAEALEVELAQLIKQAER